MSDWAKLKERRKTLKKKLTDVLNELASLKAAARPLQIEANARPLEPYQVQKLAELESRIIFLKPELVKLQNELGEVSETLRDMTTKENIRLSHPTRVSDYSFYEKFYYAAERRLNTMVFNEICDEAEQ